ncbi:hypothetical protein LU298_00305 [Komagataeibacter intermedius]|uniref:Uncharacterized protein n=2 Tax=Komagataeibacter intermedius TaxID=66229 RepID=A0A0N1FDR6_9PROT|nr:hypothetical protein [Komagataeibacter intermedius]KPH88880.1 hypothetical protein GLUCOINTEAF2_0200009 [Komagataeibacter intermedius AF2]MCF3634949.1 hypothetical protein [Komagataeibacter intermedius]GAN86318.1 hypothetical protein Gain_0026_031 [Komagataeibacter intermedius TF2]GBQ66539.1 hypothetical protein AA0521_0770 [Komagataeibacter intermedius NRIC 0521]
MSETISRPKCVQMPAPAIVVEDQIDRVLEQVAAPVDLPAFATPTQIGRRLAVVSATIDKLEQTEDPAGLGYNLYLEEYHALIDRIITMQPDNLHDIAAILGASTDRLFMLKSYKHNPIHVENHAAQFQQIIYGILRFLMHTGIDIDALAPTHEIQRILGTEAEATPSALRDLADTMERQFVEIGNVPDNEWPIDHGPQVLMDYWANVDATQKQTVQSAEDVVSLARIARTLENSLAEGDKCPALENIHRMLVSAILDGYLPSPAGRDASVIAKATAATTFGRHVDDAADHFPNDEAGNEALVRLVNKREDMMDDLIRCKPTSLQGFAAMAQAIVESDPGVKEGGEPTSDSRHLAAFARHLAAAAPQSGVNPDIALINDCNRFCVIEARSNKLWTEAKTRQEEDAATLACAPFEEESRALMERITALEAHTPAGNTARARALSLFAPDLLEPSERLDCAQNMLAALARDTLAMGASA